MPPSVLFPWSVSLGLGYLVVTCIEENQCIYVNEYGACPKNKKINRKMPAENQYFCNNQN